MTDGQTTDEGAAAMEDRYTLRRVNMAGHGNGEYTLTFLLDGNYYTVTCRPDFTRVDDEARLYLNPTGSMADALKTQLKEFSAEVNAGRYLSVGQACRQHLIKQLINGERVKFSAAFRSYLKLRYLEDCEPTNMSYYEAIKIFNKTWLEFTNQLQG